MKAAWARGDFDGVFDGEELRRKRSKATQAAWGRGAYGEEYRRKKSDATKAAWARGDMDGIFDNEEARRKRSKAQRAAWARGVFGEEWRRKISEGLKAAHARGCYDGVFQSPTSIEIEVAAALDIMGIEHETQCRPEGYSRIYDVFISPNTLIEINGDYFHSEEHFPGIQQRDAEKAQWATDNGYELIVIWEHEIKERGAWAIIVQAFT